MSEMSYFCTQIISTYKSINNYADTSNGSTFIRTVFFNNLQPIDSQYLIGTISYSSLTPLLLFP